VFRSIIDGVNTNGIYAQLLEVYDIALATSSVGDGVLCVGRAAWLIVDSADVETLLASEESIALDSNGGDSTLLDWSG